MQPKRIGYGKGRIAFIAQIEQIQSLLQQGHTQKDIYERLQSNLDGLSYSQFSMHVRKRVFNYTSALAKAATEPTPKPDKGNTSANQDSTSGRPRRFEPGPQRPDPSLLY